MSSGVELERVLPKWSFNCLLCGRRKRCLSGWRCVECLRKTRGEIQTAIAMVKAGLTANHPEP